MVVSISTGADEVASWIGDGEDGVTDGAVVPDSIGEGVETTGEGVEETGEGVETTGAVDPDSIGEGVETIGEGVEETGEGVETTGAVDPDSIGEGVETIGEGVERSGAVDPDSIGEGEDGETWGAVDRGGLTGLEEGIIIATLLVAEELGGEQLDDGPGVHSKFISTTPIGTLGPDGELGWTVYSW